MIEQRSKAWFKQRSGRVTASNVGAILGVDPHRGPEDVLRAMVRTYKGAESEFKGNVATEYGNHHEKGAIFDYQLETGNDVQECGFYEYSNWLGASPDGLVGGVGLIEVKCPYGKRDEKSPKFKPLLELPHYYAQVQIQLYCTGKKWCDFFQWSTHGTSLSRYHLCDEYIAQIMPMLQEFYFRFRSEIDNPIHLEDKRQEIDTPDVAMLLKEYDSIDEAVDLQKERMKEILAELVDISKQRDALLCGERKLTNVERKGSVAYAKAIKELAPDACLEKWRGKKSNYWKLT